MHEVVVEKVAAPVGGEFDPDAFDLTEADRAVGKVRQLDRAVQPSPPPRERAVRV